MEEYKQPLCLTVTYRLAFEFRRLVEQLKDCHIEKVIEIKSGYDGFIQYWIKCPKEHENLITDYAFMTYIKNPVFQKYYHETKAFEEIAEQYINERLNKEYGQSDYTKVAV